MPVRILTAMVATALIFLVTGCTGASSITSSYDGINKKLTPLYATVELNTDQSLQVKLRDGSVATVKLLKVEVTRDETRQAVREARVSVEVNGISAILPAASYNLPRTVGGVQIDCTAVNDYLTNGRSNPWGLHTDARFRLWPADSPWVRPGTFGYPIAQRWFATDTQMGNEPVFVDGIEVGSAEKIYYHSEQDIGGVEGLTEIVAVADGVVITAGEDVWPDAPKGPKRPRYDKVMVRDIRGWYETYYHLHSIDPAIRPGSRVVKGQRIGLLGKKGHSGGWAHLHFGLTTRQPSGRWGSEDAYAFLWQAYMEAHKPKIIAVARPHHYTLPGKNLILDAGKSWSSAVGGIVKYEWTFTDGSTATGSKVKRSYNTLGEYSEILKVTDSDGNVGYDFAVVQVADPQKPHPISLHLTHHPTSAASPGDVVMFAARSFGSPNGDITLDFGDGSETVKLNCIDGKIDPLAPDGYAIVTHSYSMPGDYIATAGKEDENGARATMRVLVEVRK